MKRRDFALTAALSPLLMTACGGGGSNGGVEVTGARPKRPQASSAQHSTWTKWCPTRAATCGRTRPT